MNKSLEEHIAAANEDILATDDPHMQEFMKTVVVLKLATFLGTDTCNLARVTGYAADFISGISERMHRAGFWRAGLAEPATCDIEKQEFSENWIEQMAVAQVLATAILTIDGKREIVGVFVN